MYYCKFYGLRPGSHQPGMGGLGTSPRDASCNEKKTEGLSKVTPSYHNNVDEFWHVVCRGHQIETQDPLKTGGPRGPCVDLRIEGWYRSSSNTSGRSSWSCYPGSGRLFLQTSSSVFFRNGPRTRPAILGRAGYPVSGRAFPLGIVIVHISIVVFHMSGEVG